MLNYLQKWIDQLRWQRLPSFQKLADMLLKHLEGILNYCRTKVRFGVVEAINGNIRMLINRGPTCWTDCGKHVITDTEGAFTISGLDPDLWFTLLALRDGYASTYIKKVDPAKGPAENAVLRPRPPIPDASQAVRGTIVDARGKPVKDAVIEQHGVTFKGTRRPPQHSLRERRRLD